MFQVTHEGPPATPSEIRRHIGRRVFNPQEIAANIALELLAPQEIGTPRTLDERIAFGLQLLHDEIRRIEQDSTMILPGNGVMILGPGAAAKTTTAEYLKNTLRYMEHRPTSELFGNKQYRVQISTCSSDAEKAAVLWEEYIHTSIRGAFNMQRKLETMPKPLSTDFIAIGGFLQSIVGLCAYTGTFEIDPETGQRILPEPFFQLILVTMRMWAPRFFVFITADQETRVKRARLQSELNPYEWQKRQMTFEHDEEIHSLLLSTLQRLQQFFISHPRPIEKSYFSGPTLPFHFLYYPTDGQHSHIPEGFTLVPDRQFLKQYIERMQNHRQRDDYFARLADTLYD